MTYRYQYTKQQSHIQCWIDRMMMIMMLVLLVCGHILTSMTFHSITKIDAFTTVTNHLHQQQQAQYYSTRIPSQIVSSSSSSIPLRHWISNRHYQPSSIQPLYMYLPPSSGGGGNNDNNESKQLLSTIVSFLGVVLFFISPLGSIFFTIFNSFLAFMILLPIGSITAFNIWQYFNTITGVCPNCGAPIRVNKKELSSSICFTCGSIVQVKDKQIYLVNPNKRQIELDDVDDVTSNIFSSFLDEFMYGQQTKSSFNKIDGSSSSNNSNSNRTSESKRNNRNTIIDVEVNDDS